MSQMKITKYIDFEKIIWDMFHNDQMVGYNLFQEFIVAMKYILAHIHNDAKRIEKYKIPISETLQEDMEDIFAMTKKLIIDHLGFTMKMIDKFKIDDASIWLKSFEQHNESVFIIIKKLIKHTSLNSEKFNTIKTNIFYAED